MVKQNEMIYVTNKILVPMPKVMRVTTIREKRSDYVTKLTRNCLGDFIRLQRKVKLDEKVTHL